MSDLLSSVCQACIGDRYLKAEIAATGAPAVCDSCHRHDVTVSMEWLADKVEEALQHHYSYTSPDPDDGIPLDLLKEGGWERSGDPLITVIADMLCTDEESISECVHQILEDRNGDIECAKCGEEDPWSADAHYARKRPDNSEYHDAWSELERTLRTESRFFNQRAAEVLSLVFDGVEELKSVFGMTELESGGPSHILNSIFRGRPAKNEDELKRILANPEKELGAPPKGTSSAQRLNAPGISVFYGADSHETVISEVRPHVGGRVVVARFKFLRNLRFLRISSFKEIRPVGSDFDPAHLRRLKQAAFLRHLSKVLNRPVTPGEETTGYLVTQAVAEFLSKRFDGLIFSSVQAGTGFNVALFGTATTVYVPPVKEGANIRVECEQMTMDGPETDYIVIGEGVEGTQRAPEQSASSSGDTLLLERNTLKVHHVTAVKYQTTDHFVSRYPLNEDHTGF